MAQDEGAALTPYWQSSCGRWTVYHGDALDILPLIDLAGVDVITDPPYAIPAAHYVGKRAEAAPRRNLGELSIVEKWFHAVSENFPDDATLYVFCDGQSYPLFFRACYSRWKRIRPLVWDKVTSFNGYTWRHQHELIAWAEPHNGERIPTGDGDILRCRAVPVDDRTHPAEKPVELIEQLVSKTKRRILDPFTGSGSTALACVRAGRSFVGVEIDERYAEIAARRVGAEASHLFAGVPA